VPYYFALGYRVQHCFYIHPARTFLEAVIDFNSNDVGYSVVFISPCKGLLKAL